MTLKERMDEQWAKRGVMEPLHICWFKYPALAKRAGLSGRACEHSLDLDNFRVLKGRAAGQYRPKREEAT